MRPAFEKIAKIKTIRRLLEHSGLLAREAGIAPLPMNESMAKYRTHIFHKSLAKMPDKDRLLENAMHSDVEHLVKKAPGAPIPPIRFMGADKEEIAGDMTGAYRALKRKKESDFLTRLYDRP